MVKFIQSTVLHGAVLLVAVASVSVIIARLLETRIFRNGVYGAVALLVWWGLVEYFYASHVHTLYDEDPTSVKVRVGAVEKGQVIDLERESITASALKRLQFWKRTYRPTLWAPTSPIQLLLSPLWRSFRLFLGGVEACISYERDLVTLEDGGLIGVDWLTPDMLAKTEKKMKFRRSIFSLLQLMLNFRVGPMQIATVSKRLVIYLWTRRIDRMAGDAEAMGTPKGSPSPLFSEETREAAVKETIVVIIPGLNSNSRTFYIRAMAADACSRGYTVAVILSRGVGGLPLHTPRLYCAGSTDDLHAGLSFIYGKHPNKKLVCIGYSMGANTIAKYLGERPYGRGAADSIYFKSRGYNTSRAEHPLPRPPRSSFGPTSPSKPVSPSIDDNEVSTPSTMPSMPAYESQLTEATTASDPDITPKTGYASNSSNLMSSEDEVAKVSDGTLPPVPIVCAVSVCNPLNLTQSGDKLKSTLVGTILTKIVKLGITGALRKHTEMMGKVMETVEITHKEVEDLNSVQCFDERITSRHFGYASSDDYYFSNSSSRFLAGINLPILFVQSRDDPFCDVKSFNSFMPRIA
eukprot:GHVN01084373.1.p1 GENE.GHVN01084373.1~~GHVN01084373.1.p1  ORF type:complete len:577 (+),score=71.92 GHVN01084373.1:31-1761(+)